MSRIGTDGSVEKPLEESRFLSGAQTPDDTDGTPGTPGTPIDPLQPLPVSGTDGGKGALRRDQGIPVIYGQTA